MATKSKTGRNKRGTSNHGRAQQTAHSERQSYHQAVHGTGHPYQQAAQQAVDSLPQSYQQAVHSAEDLQEKAGTWWRTLLGSEGWQKQIADFTQIANNSIPLAQRNLGQLMAFLEKSSRNTAKLMNQFVDAAQSASPSEAQARFVELWSSGIKAVQSNLDAVSELSTRTFDSWTVFIRKTAE